MNFTRLSFGDILKEERLREYNDCHNPGGPGGGQFCSKGGGDAFHGGTAGKTGDSSFARRADRLAATASTPARSAAWSKAAKFSRAKQAEGDESGTNIWTRQSPGFRKGINDLVKQKEEALRSGSDPVAAGGRKRGAARTPATAHAAGTDAAKRSAQAGGRKAWSQDDYNAAVRAYDTVNPPSQKTAAPIAGPGAKKVTHKFEYAPAGSAHMGTYRGMNVHTLPGYVTPYYYVDAPGFGSFHHTPSMGRLKNQINAFKTTGETPSAASKRKGSERYQKRKARYGR